MAADRPDEMNGAAPAVEGRLSTLVELGADVITVHHEDGDIFYAAPSLPRVLGYAIEDWVGRPLAELIHEEDRALAEAQWRAMLAAPGVAQPGCFRVRHRS